MKNTEDWVWVEGYEGHYKVSNTGKVLSIKSNKILSLNRITKDGYNYVALSKNNKAKEFKIHRLVAIHFIPNTKNKPTVNHIDGNKQNNSVENLEWATREENMQHAYDLGLKEMHKGSKHSRAKLTNEQVVEIKATYQRYKRGFGSVALAKKYGVESSTILRIVQGKRYVEDV